MLGTGCCKTDAEIRARQDSAIQNDILKASGKFDVFLQMPTIEELSKSGKPLFTYTPICGENTKMNYLINNWLPKSGLVIVQGFAGSGKSWLTLSMAQAVKDNIAFGPDYEDVSGGQVVYFVDDMEEMALIRRMQKASDLSNMNIYNINYDLDVDEFSLSDYITSTKQKLVVIDDHISLVRKYHTPSVYSFNHGFYYDLRLFAAKNDLCVILIQDVKRSALGDKDITIEQYPHFLISLADSVLVVQSEGKTGSLTSIKARNWTPKTIRFKFEDSSMRFER